MLGKLLKIQSSEGTSQRNLKRIVVTSKNEEGEKFIDDYGSEFLGKYYDFSLKSKENILALMIIEKQLDNKNIQKSLGCFINQNTIIFVYSLGKQIKIKGLDIDDITQIMLQMTDSIIHLHENRIIHSNITLKAFSKYEDGIKLSCLEESFILLENKSKIINREPYEDMFRPLESFNNECGFETDIWALGCAFCQLLYGKNLFPFQLEREQYISCLNSWREGTKNLNGDMVEIPKTWIIPEYFSLNSLILKMLNPNKDKRPTIFEVKRILISEDDYELGSSPQDVASFMEYLPEYKSCSYDDRSILGETRNFILEELSEHPRVLIKLTMAIYENIQTEHGFNKKNLNEALNIANSLIGEDSIIEPQKLKNNILKMLNGFEIFDLYSFFT